MPSTMVLATGERQEICERMRAEYLEMPGLILTAAQAQRRWRLNSADCEAALRALVQEGFLTCAGGGFARPSTAR